MLGDERRRLRHRLRIGAVDLDADRTLTLFEISALQGATNPPADGLRAQELGQHDIGAHPAADLAERRFRYPGHGGQEERNAVLGRIGNCFMANKIRQEQGGEK